MNRQILDEASRWFVDFRVGDVDAAARARFDEWLRASPEHVRAYMQMASTYVDLPQMTNREIDSQALIAFARGHSEIEGVLPFAVGVRGPPSQERPHRATAAASAAFTHHHRLAWSMAVVCAVALFLAWMMTRPDRIYKTDIGERRAIVLADGSSIELDARSEVRVHFYRAERDIDLVDGQALFHVAKDGARPFVVQSNGTEVRAVGTQFDVDRRSRGTTVTVVAGVVAVVPQRRSRTIGFPASGPDGVPGATLLKAGEQVTATGKVMTAPTRVDVAAATAWLNSRLVFDGTPLMDVVDAFNRYNRRPILIEDPQLRGLEISGAYSSTDPTSLIRFLQAQPDLRVIETDDSVLIGRANPQ